MLNKMVEMTRILPQIASDTEYTEFPLLTFMVFERIQICDKVTEVD